MCKSILIFLFALSINASAQVCIHTDLSKSFDFKTEVRRIKRPDSRCDSSVVTITAISKLGKKHVQSITIPTDCLSNSAYVRCTAARSYTTGKNLTADAPDNDYGDIIVADFNFDGRDDFAAKYDSGGNSGPTYAYCIQRADGTFAFDIFLTNRMSYFPSILNKTDRSLTTQVPSGISWMDETTFKFDPRKISWQLVKHKRLTISTK
jgi:hypothetical protein